MYKMNNKYVKYIFFYQKTIVVSVELFLTLFKLKGNVQRYSKQDCSSLQL